MNLLMGLYRAHEAFGDSWSHLHLAISEKSVEGSREESKAFYTIVEGMRGVQGFLDNSRDLLYILVPRLVHRIV